MGSLLLCRPESANVCFHLSHMPLEASPCLLLCFVPVSSRLPINSAILNGSYWLLPPWLQVEQLEAERAQQQPLAEALQQLAAEKAALEERLAQAEADGASLRRMVRMLKYGDSTAPSPAPPSLAGGSEGGTGSAARPGMRSRARRQDDEEEEEAAGQQAYGGHSDSGSSDEAEARQTPQGRGTVKRGSGAGAGSPSHRFLEEQVQSLTAALRRLQRHNRKLSAQLEAAGPAGGPAAGTLVPAADSQLEQQQQAPAAVSALQQEVSSLAAENAALRRQLAEAEEEAGRAQWAMHHQQAEARALHSQVVEVRWLGLAAHGCELGSIVCACC